MMTKIMHFLIDLSMNYLQKQHALLLLAVDIFAFDSF